MKSPVLVGVFQKTEARRVSSAQSQSNLRQGLQNVFWRRR
jgi:hypothetical protein